ncbi:MAG: DUF4433 domain-containing protein [Bacteroidetes bacterium]|nr:MAG: DUF4433 domain-containing protein [Bacteroidota bacterium]
MLPSSKIWLYRITHLDNLGWILKHGIASGVSELADPGFISIGDNTLIEFREDMDIPVSPFGKFSEYIPFYFGPRAPMLYQIATGYDGIKKIPQSNIIYLVSRLDIIQSAGLQFIFTDGHARATITTFFTANETKKLKELDWSVIYSTDWKNTEQDKDRQRRKQAECLIKDFIPTTCVERILVFDENSHEKVLSLIHESNLSIPVQIKKAAYYDPL